MTPKNFNTNEKFLMTTNMLHIISTQAIKIKCVHDFRRNCQGHITSILINILLEFSVVDRNDVYKWKMICIKINQMIRVFHTTYTNRKYGVLFA